MRTQLTKRVKWVVDNPPTNGELSLKEEVEVFVRDKNLTNGPVDYYWLEGNEYEPHVEICLHNISSRIIEPGFLKVGFIATPHDILQVKTDTVEIVKLPDGRHLYLLPDLPTLLPDEYGRARITFVGYSDFTARIGEEVKIILRLFTAKGARDFEIRMRQNPKK